MTEPLCLSDLLPGQRARVTALSPRADLRRRLLDLGLIPDTLVTCVGVSPSGDPKAFLIRGAVIALRREDCSRIYIHFGREPKL